jgi:hypothetical protein
MEFRNKLEEDCFQIANDIVGSSGSIKIEHNKKLSIDWSKKRSQITFSGLPSKEIDVLSLNLFESSDIYLLVSCKHFEGSRCSAMYIQEWGNIVDVFNRNTSGKTYFGLIVSSTGFQRGCESWAMQNNLGLIPPYKGKTIKWPYDIILKMFRRTLTTYIKVIGRNWKQFKQNSDFYWSIFKLNSDLEYEI